MQVGVVCTQHYSSYKCTETLPTTSTTAITPHYSNYTNYRNYIKLHQLHLTTPFTLNYNDYTKLDQLKKTTPNTEITATTATTPNYTNYRIYINYIKLHQLQQPQKLQKTIATTSIYINYPEINYRDMNSSTFVTVIIDHRLINVSVFLQLYRSTPAGLEGYSEYGIKIVINLRFSVLYLGYILRLTNLNGLFTL